MSSVRSDLALDADVLMNLLASDHLSDVLAANGSRGLLCPRTEAEVIYLNPRAPGSPREAADLAPHLASGTLVRTMLDGRETATYVQLATEVDDGEAQVLAVGLHRGLVVATDDRRARRVAARLGVGLTSTPELIVTWAAASGTHAANVGQAILDIEIRARYRPRTADPNRTAWDGLKVP
jgi:predicted nucleic acid-binding protein